MADDYKGTTVAAPADTDKKQSLAGTKEMLGAFPDVKILPMTTWAAGDYVVVAGTFDGTNTGDMPSAKMKKTGNKVSAHFLEIFKFSGGKVQEDWLFYNGAAMTSQLMAAKK
jgi:predicted ester cyclase